MGFGDEMPENEARIAGLVAALDDLDGVHTIRSCAGHEDPIDSHVEEYAFEVHFELEPTADAWGALRHIAQTCEAIGPASLTFESDNGEYAFHLLGFADLDPDLLASAIRSA